jgi:hypothetical protein
MTLENKNFLAMSNILGNAQARAQKKSFLESVFMGERQEAREGEREELASCRST